VAADATPSAASDSGGRRPIDDRIRTHDRIEPQADFPLLEERRAYLERAVVSVEGAKAAATDGPDSPRTLDEFTQSLWRQQETTDECGELAGLHRAYLDRASAELADDAAVVSLAKESMLMDRGAAAARRAGENPLGNLEYVEAAAATLGRRALDLFSRGDDKAAGRCLHDQKTLVDQAIGHRRATAGDLATVAASIEPLRGRVWDIHLKLAALRDDQGHFDMADTALRARSVRRRCCPRPPPPPMGCGGNASYCSPT